jgi:hypothetical protein
MLPFGVTISAAVPQRSEIPEGLMNSIISFLSKNLNILEVEPTSKQCFIDESKTTANNHMYHFGKFVWPPVTLWVQLTPI